MSVCFSREDRGWKMRVVEHEGTLGWYGILEGERIMRFWGV